MTQTSRSTQSSAWGQSGLTALESGHCGKGLGRLWAQAPLGILLGHPRRLRLLVFSRKAGRTKGTWFLFCMLWDSARRDQERIEKVKLYGCTCCLSMPRPPT